MSPWFEEDARTSAHAAARVERETATHQANTTNPVAARRFVVSALVELPRPPSAKLHAHVIAELLATRTARVLVLRYARGKVSPANLLVL